jgi:hypothetical protein
MEEATSSETFARYVLLSGRKHRAILIVIQDGIKNTSNSNLNVLCMISEESRIVNGDRPIFNPVICHYTGIQYIIGGDN